MTQAIYEKLTDALRLRGGAAPAIHCREFYALMEELFTPEEAELASKMPLGLVSAAELVTETGGDPKVAEELLESMANKGLLLSFVQHDVMHYDLLQLVPGIFEMQFMTGEVSERAKRLAHLFEDYFNAMQRLPRRGAGGLFPTFPWARVVTVEREIPAGVEVHPYDMVSQYIENAPYISVATCYCRHHGELVDRPCDKPKDNCMGIGPGAKSLADRGFSRLISKEEAREILKRSEEAGLVHLSSNTSKYIDFICNCCICHCGILQSVKNAAAPGMAAVSSFVASLEKGDCSDCGDCVERCPMDALAMEDDVMTLDSNRCIGCGLCVSVCPTGALRLELREGAPLPPRDRGSLGAALMSSMQPNT
jgi:ferredoxin